MIRKTQCWILGYIRREPLPSFEGVVRREIAHPAKTLPAMQGDENGSFPGYLQSIKTLRKVSRKMSTCLCSTVSVGRRRKAENPQLPTCTPENERPVKYRISSSVKCLSPGARELRPLRQTRSTTPREFELMVRPAQPQSALSLFSKTARPCALFTLQWYLDSPQACLRRRVCTRVLIG